MPLNDSKDSKDFKDLKDTKDLKVVLNLRKSSGKMQKRAISSTEMALFTYYCNDMVNQIIQFLH